MTPWLLFASLNAFLAVAAGAWASHGADGVLGADGVTRFNTAARYQMVHALALIATGLLAADAAGWPLSLLVSALAFAFGIVLFCGGLYLLALTGRGIFSRMAPLGGLAFMAGWLALAWFAAIGA